MNSPADTTARPRTHRPPHLVPLPPQPPPRADAVTAAWQALDRLGWCVTAPTLPADLLAALREQLVPAAQLRHALRQRQRVEGDNDGTLHHLVGDHPVFLALLDALQGWEPLLASFFGGPCVLNSYGGVINEWSRRAYVHAVHRDIRFASADRRFMLNLLVMLDDFTPDNGATRLLSGSHTRDERPGDDEFHRDAERALGDAGSLLFFDSRLWHAAGVNRTEQPRRALTLTFTAPFFKPQLDYCRLLGMDTVRAMNPWRRQLLGWHARVPDSLEHFYVPVAERWYQRGQDR